MRITTVVHGILVFLAACGIGYTLLRLCFHWLLLVRLVFDRVLPSVKEYALMLIIYLVCCGLLGVVSYVLGIVIYHRWVKGR